MRALIPYGSYLLHRARAARVYLDILLSNVDSIAIEVMEIPTLDFWIKTQAQDP